jgi:uncharacterized protein involved in response to NO
LLQTARHARWAGDRTIADRLVLVLHVAYAFIPLGFLLMGAAIVWPAIFPTSAGLHAWMAGGVLMVIRPLYRRIHLTGLSQEAGPPLGVEDLRTAEAGDRLLQRRDAEVGIHRVR